MWSQLIKVASMSKGALVVGVAASAAVVSTAEFSNTPSHNEVPSATPIVVVTPSASSRPANSPSSSAEPKKADAPAAQLPASTTPPPSSPSTGAAGLAHGEVPGVIRECVEKYLALRELGDHATNGERESTGAVCKAALEVSGLSGADFWAKFGPETHATSPKTEPSHTPDPSTDTQHWIRECVTKYTLKAADATVTCRKAIELTGLTSAEFAVKYFPRTTETKPTTTPSTTKPGTAPTTTPKIDATTKPATTVEVSQLAAKCLQMYAEFKTSGGNSAAVSEACGTAIRASGLSSSDFWAKYHPATN